MYLEDTIGAIATPPGVGGVGIIRVSGKEAFSLVDSLFKSQGTVPLMDRPNRTIQYGHIVEEGRPIDEVLLLLMKGPHSYTAEDVVEIQCHGGIVPIRKIMEALLRKGMRLAEPGEFTRRAFLNGRIDLTQAEAIVDIIEAKTEESLQLAMNQLDGTLSSLVGSLRELLIELVARLEVTIDYPEEDIEELTAQEVRVKLNPIKADMEQLLATAHRGRLIRDGIGAAIIGLPNAGKSSLMNALLRENRAIVTDIPGTTRDSIEEYMNIEGISLRLIDTAGIRETDDVVEKMGVDRAKTYLDEADLVLCVIDGSKPLNDEERVILRSASRKPSVVFINKGDLGQVVTKEDIAKEGNFTGIEEIVASTGKNTFVLGNYVKELVYGGEIRQNHEATLGNIRHILLMEKALQAVEQAVNSIEQSMPIEFVATDLREAWEILGEITGESLRDDMSKELFSRFCLGK